MHGCDRRARTGWLALLLCGLLGMAAVLGQAQPPAPQSAATYRARTLGQRGRLIDLMVVPGRPPANFRLPALDLRQARAAGAVTLPNMPTFDWSYGCSATAAAMMMGYYDNIDYPEMYVGPTNNGVCPKTNASWGIGECPLSATRMGYDGRSVRGHVDDYWVVFGHTGPDPYATAGWAEHALGECTGDYMGTNQARFGNMDGATTFFFYTDGSRLDDYTGSEPAYRDGCHGMRLFANACGYTTTANYSQYILGYNGNTRGFSFNDYIAEIDAGRPVMIQVAGHSMVGVGYNTTGNLVYLHDTWDYATHEMTWGGSYAGMQHYGVTVFRLAANGNRAPTARDGTLTVARDTAGSGILQASDPDGDPLNFRIVENGALGTAAVTNAQTGAFTYTPRPGATGQDRFTFRADDGTLDSNIATVTVAIGGGNTPPTARNDTYRVTRGARLVVAAPGVLANDADANQQALTARLIYRPRRGTLTLNADGSFTYVPQRRFYGVDYFAYRAYDGQAFSSLARVTILVSK